MNPLRIGTRASPLALWQANHVAARLRAAHPDLALELVEIQTTGDQIRDLPLSQIGGDGLFTKAIQDALLDHRVDVAVHSLKDLPTTPAPDLVLAAVPQRGPTGDAFLATRVQRLADLPRGATMATSSIRRRAQLLFHRPDLNLVNIRGNVETRLRKLESSDLDGLVLAEAGLWRLNLQEKIREVLDPAWMLPAVGQGALGLECRVDDAATRKRLVPLDDPATHARIRAERSLLRNLGGGCQVPLGAITRLEQGRLWLRGAVIDPKGRKKIDGEMDGPPEEAEALGLRLAHSLLEQGAQELLQGILP